MKTTTITTVEQEGEWTGQEVGRLWLKWPGLRGWAWIGYGSRSEAANVAADLNSKRLGSGELAAWFDAQ